MARSHHYGLLVALCLGIAASTANAATCPWSGHCLGDRCRTYNDCYGSMICITGKCGYKGGTTPTPSPSPSPAPTTSCSWPGHCLGDPCVTYNDCDGSMICISGKCGNSGGTTPTPSPSPSPVPPPTTTSKKTTITSYNVMSTDNTSPGALAEHQVTQNFVNNVNIVAVHSMHWAQYKYLPLDITYRGVTVRFIVMDYCADSDCGGCCTTNMNYAGNGFLTDVDSSAALRIWGITNAENSLYDSATFTVASTQQVDVAALLRQYGGTK